MMNWGFWILLMINVHNFKSKDFTRHVKDARVSASAVIN